MSKYTDDSQGMRLVVAAFRRRYRREPRGDERERLRAALDRAASVKRTPVKFVSTTLERGPQNPDRLLVVERALGLAESDSSGPPNVPRRALAHAAFTPDGYLFAVEGMWDQEPRELVAWLKPVQRFGQRLLLGSGRYLVARDDMLFVRPADVAGLMPADPTHGIRLLGGAVEATARGVIAFSDLPDRAAPPGVPGIDGETTAQLRGRESRGWNAMHTAVLRALERLVDGSGSLFALVFGPVSGGQHGWFVQCELDDEDLIVEAVSDESLDRPERLSPAQLEALKALGWGTAQPGEGYRRGFAMPVPLGDLAKLVAATLIEVYHLADVRELAIEDVEEVGQKGSLIVASDGSGMFTTIGDALVAAVEGDEILVRPGDYWESVFVDKSLEIRGDGPRERIVVRPPVGNVPCIRIRGGEPRIVGLTLDGTWIQRDGSDEDEATLLVIHAGSPSIEALDFDGSGVEIGGRGTAGSLLRCRFHGKTSGIFVHSGASPRIEDNEVLGTVIGAGIEIRDEGTAPTVRANRIHDGEESGVYVHDRAAPLLEANDIRGNVAAGIEVRDLGTDPVVQGNRIYEGLGGGVLVSGGAKPRIEKNQISANAIAGIEIRDAGSDPLVRHNRVYNGDASGIYVHQGSCPRIEGNELWGNGLSALRLADAGTNPIVRENRIHHGPGVWVEPGAGAQIEGNEIWAHTLAGIQISGPTSQVLVRANLIHDGEKTGISVRDGATPRIEDNEIWGNGMSGIQIADSGSSPLVLANRVHDGKEVGILVSAGATPRISDNEVWANLLAGIEVRDPHSDPIVQANRVHDCQHPGLWVHAGASPRIENNEIWANANAGIAIAGRGTAPLVRANQIHHGEEEGILIEDGASPRIEQNEIWGNASAGIWIGDPGTSPLLRANHMHDSGNASIYVDGLASPRIEDDRA